MPRFALPLLFAVGLLRRIGRAFPLFCRTTGLAKPGYIKGEMGHG